MTVIYPEGRIGLKPWRDAAGRSVMVPMELWVLQFDAMGPTVGNCGSCSGIMLALSDTIKRFLSCNVSYVSSMS
ncbi:hypothetical protein RRG08_058745 [Elysia crispata]|uniref:Uncharacterized protein n=1 Tax=Elysia crispata TaxID=231223 RepID=A0AAE1D6E4_9GAST|nr:hypothetical protein RRG08_058745 [Elysia crispata]